MIDLHPVPEIWLPYGSSGEFSRLYIHGIDTLMTVQAFVDGTAAWWVQGNVGTHAPSLKNAQMLCSNHALANSARKYVELDNKVRYLYGVWCSLLQRAFSLVLLGEDPKIFEEEIRVAKEKYTTVYKRWSNHSIALVMGEFLYKKYK